MLMRKTTRMFFLLLLVFVSVAVAVNLKGGVAGTRVGRGGHAFNAVHVILNHGA